MKNNAAAGRWSWSRKKIRPADFLRPEERFWKNIIMTGGPFYARSEDRVGSSGGLKEGSDSPFLGESLRKYAMSWKRSFTQGDRGVTKRGDERRGCIRMKRTRDGNDPIRRKLLSSEAARVCC